MPAARSLPPSVLCAGAASLALTIGAARDAAAYCRTSVCNGKEVGSVCDPPEPTDCGVPLYWTQLCIGFSVQQDASRQVPWEIADGIVATAFATWQGADCGGGEGPTIGGVDLGPVSCAAREYNSSGGNANIVVFRDEQWPYAGQWNTLALTTVTFNLDTGEIYDADLEVNASGGTLTWDDQDVQYDLPSIITHEVGHMLGLAHSSDADATMFSDYRPGYATLRDLAPDDIVGICTVYPPGPPRDSLPCDPTPRHGFKSDCGPGEPPDEGCSVAGVAARSGRPLELGWLSGLGFIALRRRRLPAAERSAGAPRGPRRLA